MSFLPPSRLCCGRESLQESRQRDGLGNTLSPWFYAVVQRCSQRKGSAYMCVERVLGSQTDTVKILAEGERACGSLASCFSAQISWSVLEQAAVSWGKEMSVEHVFDSRTFGNKLSAMAKGQRQQLGSQQRTQGLANTFFYRTAEGQTSEECLSSILVMSILSLACLCPFLSQHLPPLFWAVFAFYKLIGKL